MVNFTISINMDQRQSCAIIHGILEINHEKTIRQRNVECFGLIKNISKQKKRPQLEELLDTLLFQHKKM